MSAIHAKRYIELLSPAGYGHPIYSPNYIDGPFLRLGDVLIESEDGRNLHRLMNAFVSSEHYLNTYKAECQLPSGFKPFFINEKKIAWTESPGPVVCKTSQNSKGGASFVLCPPMYVKTSHSPRTNDLLCNM